MNGLRRTAEMLAIGENVERDLMAARTGARKTWKPRKVTRQCASYCANCYDSHASHVRESGILFCSESALREAYGR